MEVRLRWDVMKNKNIVVVIIIIIIIINSTTTTINILTETLSVLHSHGERTNSNLKDKMR